LLVSKSGFSGTFVRNASSQSTRLAAPVQSTHHQTRLVAQRRTFFGSRQQQQQQQSNNSHSHQGNHNNYTRFERQDPGLKWTATLSNPAPVAGPEGVPSRAEQLEQLKAPEHEEYDVLIVGGGATGAGIALDAAHRGLTTACIERGDFASETSSRSTKLIWAGLKYMGTAVASLLTPQNYWDKGVVETVSDFWGELKMVYHCHVERHYMTTKNQHLCHWIPIAVPFNSWFMTNPAPMNFSLYACFPLVAPLVFKAYDALSGFSCPPSYIMRPSAVTEYFPQLKADALKYCAVFYEAQHNDSRTNLAIALTAAQKGAHICNYVAATELLQDEDGRVTGAVVVDRMTQESFPIRAKKVIFAGGPFTDGLRNMEVVQKQDENESSQVKSAVRGASGTHVVLPGHFVPQPQNGKVAMGLLDPSTSDGRFLFILPWLGHTLIGTTDTKCDAETLPSAPQNEVDWILEESKKYWNEDYQSEFTKPQNLLSAWRGWRPLAMDPHAAADGPVSRDHVISEHPVSQCIFIAGGKWTTWREMAQDVVDKVTKTPCDTLNVSLFGAEGYSDSLATQVQEKYPQLDMDVCEHLVSTYGGRVWEVCNIMDRQKEKGNKSLHRRLVENYPYIEAEVIYATHEYACNVEDILSRRTRLAYLNREAALEALPRVAELLQDELQWTTQVTQEQVQAAQAYVASYGGGGFLGDDHSVSTTTTKATDAKQEKETPVMIQH